MKTEALYVSIESESAFADLLRQGGFDVEPMNEEPWEADRVSWQGFLCHRNGAIIVASVAIDHEGEWESFVAVHPCRKILWLWNRPRDLRLMREVVDHLLRNGGRIVEEKNG